MIEKLLVPFLSGTRHRKMTGCFAVLFFLTSSFALAQDASRALRGAWEIETPDKGTLILVLKGQGLASYFWGDNADRNVYQGKWTVEGESAVASWPDGSALVLEKTASGFSATLTRGSDGSKYEAATKQLPQNVLGQWAKPPQRDRPDRGEQEEAEGYFGTWMIGEDASKFIFVQPDRSAASTKGNTSRGQRGQWARQGSELHIIWDSGEYSILSETDRGYTYKIVESGAIIEEDETDTASAIRTNDSQVPADWMAAYQAERELASGGIAFTSRKQARAFYRGDWVIRRGDTVFERIEIKRFGGLSTSAERSLDGQWRQSGQDIFMRWDNGMRKILSPVGEGFVLYEFRPGRPLDGVPTRVLAGAPANTAKFEKYLAGRTNVAEQVREMAMAAGIPESERSGGWGRTFARWAWPFGGESESENTDELLAAEYSPESEDPWWWPFWSETRKEVTETSEEAEDSAEENESEAKEVATDSEPAQEKDTPKKKSGWQWPF